MARSEIARSLVRRGLRRTALLAPLLLLPAVLPFAPTHAEAPVRLVVPFGPGAVQDTVARSFSAELSKALNANVVVENHAGAGGTIGSALVAKAPPDGRTLLLAGASHNLAGYLYPNLPYDLEHDFVGVSAIGTAGYVIAAPAGFGVSTLSAFVEKIAAQPGRFNYGSAGNGSATHMGMAYFLKRANLDMQQIPMKSTGEAVNELLAERTQGVMAATIAVIGFQQDPRIRLLAYTGAQRSTFMPKLPTVRESGIRGLGDFAFDSWVGILAPAGTPSATVERIDTALHNVLAQPAVQDRLHRIGVERLTEPALAFQKRLANDRAMAERIVRESGARLD